MSERFQDIVNTKYTRNRKATKWYFVLAKDYKTKGYEDIQLRRSIAKIKTDWIMK